MTQGSPRTRDPAASSRTRRWAIAAAIALLALVAAGYFALRAGVAVLERDIAKALGPDSSFGAIRADWHEVVVSDLRIAGGPGWPSADALRAAEVRIAPSWRSLASDRIQIARVEVTGGYLSALRSRDGLRVLPSLTEAPQPTGLANPADAPPPAPKPAERVVAIGAIHLQQGELELYDATVATPPWKVHVQQIDATLRDVLTPAFEGRMPLELSGVLSGPSRNGNVSLSGWLDAHTRDLELDASLRGADLLALEPYFLEKTRARLRRGALDLDLRAVVAARQLRAPGRLTLSDLAFGHGSATERVFGVPRDLLLAGLAARGGKITIDFSLDGDIDDPHFAVREMLATRVALEIANQLGFSVGGLVEGIGGLGVDGLEGAGKAGRGIGSALRKLVPKRK